MSWRLHYCLDKVHRLTPNVSVALVCGVDDRIPRQFLSPDMKKSAKMSSAQLMHGECDHVCSCEFFDYVGQYTRPWGFTIVRIAKTIQRRQRERAQ